MIPNYSLLYWLISHLKSDDDISVPEIEATMSMTPDAFKSKVGVEMPTKECKILVHCMIGGRAKRAYDALKAMGFAHLDIYPGSFNDLISKGGEIQKL